VNKDMGCGCYGDSRTRSFLTKEERVALLKEYQDELEKEKQGVTERIKQLEVS
jgi:flagellar motility protein MotE (MotC chaperone)